MCGIIGFIGYEPAAPIVLAGLLKLEYREKEAKTLIGRATWLNR